MIDNDIAHPRTGELLAAIALLMVKNDALLLELEHPHVGRSHVFTTHDLKRGAEMGPMASITDEGHLLVRLES